MVNLARIPVLLAIAVAWHLFIMHLTPRLGLTRPNFRQETIPASYGIIALGYLLCGLAILLLLGLEPGGRVMLIAITTAVMCILGFIDDIFGSRDATGFKGHFKMLLAGRCTTGALKAIGGGLCGLAAGYIASGGNLLRWIIVALLIPLGANMINLLDLRPGRAGGAVLVSIGILSPFMLLRGGIAFFVLLVSIVACFTVWDGMAKAMMGDSGSNMLGAAMGLCVAFFADLYVQVAFVAFMVWAQIYSEKHSITALIDRNPTLRRIDRMLGVR